MSEQTLGLFAVYIYIYREREREREGEGIILPTMSPQNHEE